ncbi:hypothetical protein I4U23_003897 [Adineta vaga]|nr:hypothetical protein I4U23_003897 [Adineta vaga]
MNTYRTCFVDLPDDVFHVIFAYLAPHDLLQAFKKLNHRFQSIVLHQPLSLPNNRSMNYKVYYDYLTRIIPHHVSQIVYLHLSERRAPHAVKLFLSQVSLKSRLWSALKAVTIEDVPSCVFNAFLSESSFLSKIQSLTFDLDFNRYHLNEYDDCDEYDIVIPILRSFSKLQSLCLRISCRTLIDDIPILKERFPQMNIHQHLQILSIKRCSNELLVQLLNHGYLPHLRRLDISLSYADHDPMPVDPPNPIPLQQDFVPKLHHVKIHLSVCVTWILTFFEDLQRHSQLDFFSITGHVRFTKFSNFPRVAELHQWLTLSKSNLFQFRMKLHADYASGARSVQEEIFNEYQRATGDKQSIRYFDMDIRYPEMSFLYPTIANENQLIKSSSSDGSISEESMEIDENASTSSSSSASSEWCRGESLDRNVKELELTEQDYVKTSLFQELEEVSCWHRLKKLTIEYDPFADEDDVVGRRLTRLAHVIQCSPHFRELFISHNLDYARALSLNEQLGVLLASKLQVLYYTTKTDSNSSLGNLAQIIDTLFSHSTSPPCLKELTLNIDGHPSSWLSIEHLIRWINKLFKRFPFLIHFTLYCRSAIEYDDPDYDLSNFASKWYFSSLINQRLRTGQIQYRHKANSIDIWL